MSRSGNSWRIHAQETTGPLHLGDRVGDAALELEYQHLLAREEVEDVAELLEVETAPQRVVHLREQHPRAALLGLSLEAGHRRAVAGDRVAQHDQETSVRRRLSQQADR